MIMIIIKFCTYKVFSQKRLHEYLLGIVQYKEKVYKEEKWTVLSIKRCKILREFPNFEDYYSNNVIDHTLRKTPDSITRLSLGWNLEES